MAAEEQKTSLVPSRQAASGDLTPLLRVAVHLVPDELDLILKQIHPAGERKPVWHYIEPQAGVLVSLWSEEERLRLVRLTVRSDTPGWNPRWGHWSYAVRLTPQDLGGDALAAQDELAEDESALTLLLLPGEQRSATLEFQVGLDGETVPGDYPFEIVLTDTETGEETTGAGLARLRHPQAGLLQYLPALYTQTPPGPLRRFAPYEEPLFFERFLRGFEDAREPLNALLSTLYRYFDADSAPADFLPWLATWVALDLDNNWPQLKRRRLIKEAICLYRWRGTRRGLTHYLEIYTGVKAEINDQPFSGMRLGPDTLLGQGTILGDVPAHAFVVTLAVPDPSAINERTVRDIIELQKPAHAAYDLRIVEREATELVLEETS
jgi:phage tail-like protein